MALDTTALVPTSGPDAYGGYPAGETRGTVNAPDLTPGLKPKVRSIKDAAQARNIVLTFQMASRDRNIKASRIMAKYNSERPYRVEALEAEGLSWKANFSTKVLPMLIDKVAPRFVQALDAVKYLTNSALPDDVEGAADKTEAFRREITSLCRNRLGWRDLLSQISQENALFGFCCVAHLDEFGWFPTFFRQDHFGIPTGCKQHAGQAQIIALKETFLISELFKAIADKEAAKIRGWNLPNVVSIINASMPEDRRTFYQAWERTYEDLIRENNLGLAVTTGARVVAVWHLFAQEIDGKVSHYIFEERSFTELFTSEDQYESMADAASFYSFQFGNGTMHGSKGIGREIYAMAGMLERSRNEVVDRLNLSGKMIIQADDKMLRRFKMSVVGNAILIGQGYNISERKIEAGVEPFLELDQFLTKLLDQMAGATSPQAFDRERVTKAEVDAVVAKEEESKDNIIARFLTQFATMMTTLQKRACSPNVSDEDAKAMQKRLLNVMSREELTQISNTPASETVRDYTEMKRQMMIVIAQEARGNPLYNQKELERRKLIAQVDEEFANAVLLPDEDPTEQAEQERLQMLELLIIADHGSTVPVSPRDNHLIHLGILLPAMEKTSQAAVNDPASVATLEAMLVHGEAHLQTAEQVGVPKDQLNEPRQILTKLRAALPELQASAEQHLQLQAKAAGVPAGQPGQPQLEQAPTSDASSNSSGPPSVGFQ